MVIAIGLDSMDIDLLRKYADEGHLPFFSSLFSNNNIQKALSFSSISSGSTWPSITTGTNPGRHSLAFSHRQLKTGTYHIEKRTADKIKEPFLWEYALNANKKVCIFDVPKVIPYTHENLKIVVGWGAESWSYSRSSFPADLLQKIITKHGEWPLIDWYHQQPKNEEAWDMLSEKLLNALDIRLNIIRDFLSNDQLDLFMTVIPETHMFGHFYQHWYETNHPQYEARLAKKYQGQFLESLKKIDSFYLEIQEMYPDAVLLTMSNSGMGPNFTGTHLLNPMLEKLGYKKSNKKKKWRPDLYALENWIGPNNIQLIKKLFPTKFWNDLTRKALHADATWPESQIFVLPSDHTGNLRVNLIGREPHGKVDKGEEFETLCQKLREDLLTFKNLETGKQLIQDVLRVDKITHGPHTDNLPDLAVVWQNDAPVNRIHSPLTGEISGSLRDKRTGSHLPFGFFGIAGKNTQWHKEQIKLEDISATILHLSGVEIPKNLEGKNLIKHKKTYDLQ